LGFVECGEYIQNHLTTDCPRSHDNPTLWSTPSPTPSRALQVYNMASAVSRPNNPCPKWPRPVFHGCRRCAQCDSPFPTLILSTFALPRASPIRGLRTLSFPPSFSILFFSSLLSSLRRQRRRRQAVLAYSEARAMATVVPGNAAWQRVPCGFSGAEHWSLLSLNRMPQGGGCWGRWAVGSECMCLILTVHGDGGGREAVGVALWLLIDKRGELSPFHDPFTILAAHSRSCLVLGARSYALTTPTVSKAGNNFFLVIFYNFFSYY
jgi:hypothetical protein